ncbi:hypothetical protein ABPG72_022762 [Tetrahymena utriculariae]
MVLLLHLNKQLSAVLHSNKDVSQNAMIQFKTQVSDLFIQIQEGNGRQFSYSQPINLTGLALDFEVEDQNSPQGIDLSWKCQQFGQIDNDQQCYDYLKNVLILPQNVQSISIPGSTFNPYQTLKLTFSGQKGDRKNVQTIIVVLVELDIPPLIIQYEDLTQLIRVNMNEDINCTIIYDSNISSDILTYAGAILYNNNVEGTIVFDYLKVKFRIWDYFTKATQQNPVVQVRFTVYNPAYIMPSLSITNFNINLPPTNCMLSVQPSGGQALTTIFTLEIKDCITQNTPLTYQFFYYSDSSDFQKEIQNPNIILRRQIADQTITSQLNTALPSGNLLIMVQAMDCYLATYNKTIQINIENNQLQEQQLLNLIDHTLEIKESQILKKKFTELCILGEELSKNKQIYNLNSVKQRKPKLVQTLISQQVHLPKRSFLSSFSNKIISLLQLAIENEQISTTQSVLNYINSVLQNQQQLLGNTYQLLNNNNIPLQNLVDSFGMLNSTTTSLSQNYINNQMNISDQICSQIYNITLPNTGGLQLKGNLITLDCQQLTQKHLDPYIMQLSDQQPKNITNLFGVAYSQFSQNPYYQTPQFQNYAQQLVQNQPNIKITKNNVIKPSIKKLNNLDDDKNILSSSNRTFIYKFPNAQQSNNTQSCIQQDQDTWSSQYCQTNNFTGISGYYCYCSQQSPTTVIDDLKSIIENKNLQTAFGSQGLVNLQNFSNFYEFAIVWVLFCLTVFQIGLFTYGQTLDKICRFSGIVQQINLNQIYPITETQMILDLNKESNNQLTSQKKQSNVKNDQNYLPLQGQIQNQENDIQKQVKQKKRRSRQSVSSTSSKIFTQTEILANQPKHNRSVQDQVAKTEINQLREVLETHNEEIDEKELIQDKQNAVTSQLCQDSERNNLREQEQLQSEEQSKSSPIPFKQDNTQSQYYKFASQTLFKKLLILHEFFGIFYIFDENLSRPIRFTLFYLRVIHSLSISTIFDETYNFNQRVMIPIISSIILIVGVQTVSQVHKIKVVGKIFSTLIVISLLTLYYYIILSIVSGESSSQSNFRLLYFVVLLGVDFIFMITLTSILKLQIINYIINKQQNSQFILIKIYNFLDLDIAVLNLNL